MEAEICKMEEKGWLAFQGFAFARSRSAAKLALTAARRHFQLALQL